jgi:hypothetical protein
LTADQVCRLLYKPGSIKYVRALLKELTDWGYTQRIGLPRTSPVGSVPRVYQLARKGLNRLRGEGLPVERRYRPSEAQRSQLFLHHSLAVADFVIGVELFARSSDDVELHEVRSERVLKRDPVYVEDSDGRRVGVVPDAWLDLRIEGSEQMCLSLELDRGTIEQRQWCRKANALGAWGNCPDYERRFNTTSLTISVVTTAGEKRRRDLLRWTESELSVIGAEGQADLFRFAAFDPATTRPADIFLSPLWYRPFDAQPVALMDAAANSDGSHDLSLDSVPQPVRPPGTLVVAV